jgi:hypothetical protein
MRGLVGVPDFLLLLIGILIFMLLRSPCEKLKPYDNPFWDFNNSGNTRKRRKVEKYFKVVVTYVYASSQGQRMHSAGTKISAGADGDPLSRVCARKTLRLATHRH